MPETTGMSEINISAEDMELLKAQMLKLRTTWAAQPTLGERFTVPREGKNGSADDVVPPGF